LRRGGVCRACPCSFTRSCLHDLCCPQRPVSMRASLPAGPSLQHTGWVRVSH
jgi:hypothetical protein